MSAEVTVDFKADTAELEKAFSKLEKLVDLQKKKIGELEKSSERASKATTASVAKGFLIAEGISRAFNGAVNFIGDSVQAAAQAEKQFSRLNSVIKNNGDSYGTTAKQLIELSNQMARQTAFTSSANNEAMIFISTLKSVAAPDQFQEVLRVSQDVATVFNTSLPAAARAVGKAMDSPVQGMTNLRKYGVMLTEEQQKQVKSFMALNDVAAAQGIVMDALKAKVAGAAEEYGKTGVGQLERMKNIWEEIKETVGGGILSELVKETDAIFKNTEGTLAAAQTLGKVLGSLTGGVLSNTMQTTTEGMAGYMRMLMELQVRKETMSWTNPFGDEEKAHKMGQMVYDQATGAAAARHTEAMNQKAERAKKAAEEKARAMEADPFSRAFKTMGGEFFRAADYTMGGNLQTDKEIKEAKKNDGMLAWQQRISNFGSDTVSPWLNGFMPSETEMDARAKAFQQDKTRMSNRMDGTLMQAPMITGLIGAAMKAMPSIDMMQIARDAGGQFAGPGFQSTFEDAQGMYDRIAGAAGSMNVDQQIAENTKKAADAMGQVRDKVGEVKDAITKGVLGIFGP